MSSKVKGEEAESTGSWSHLHKKGQVTVGDASICGQLRRDVQRGRGMCSCAHVCSLSSLCRAPWATKMLDVQA